MTLSDKIIEHTKKQKTLFLPYLWDKWGVEPEKFTDALCKVWYRFESPRMNNNLLVLNQHEQPNQYEVCDTRYNRGVNIHKRNYWKYCYNNQKEDQHVSVYAHDQKWIDNYEEKGSVSCRNTKVGVDYIYLELDRESLEKACRDALKFYLDFPFKERCSLWYSGNKSVHIQIDASLFGKPMGSQHNITGRGKLIYNMAHKLAGDLRHDNGVTDPWMMSRSELKEAWTDLYPNRDIPDIHELRQKLENIDPNLFSVNSLIRQPYSYHEKGKEQKKELSTEELLFGISEKDQKNLDIKQKISYIDSVQLPHLIHWVYDCYEPKVKKRTTTIDADEGEIIEVFQKVFDYFDKDEANPDGWVNGLFSPFYKDTNNSVSVNIKTGHYHDFGHSTHSMNFKQFKEKLNYE